MRIFVTATDTGVGKTEASTALLSLLADRGVHPAPFKPYESGCARLDAPKDAMALIAAARSDDELDLVCPHRFEAPLAPGVAAKKLGVVPSFRRTLSAFARFADRPLVVEGAGGLRVPIDGKRDIIDLIERLGLPVLLVTRASLGTLNHTALSLDLLLQRKIKVEAVLVAHSAATADPSARENAELIRSRHRVRVLGPVPFERDPRRRRTAYRKALAPLLSDTCVGPSAQ